MKTISVQAMKDVDYRTIHEGGISAQRLMKRAGAGVASEIKYFLEDLPLRHKQRVVILCGKGNNGGDGYVVADILSDQIEVAVYSTCPVEDLKDDALFYARSLLSLNKASYSVKALLKPEDFRNGDIVVDALLGQEEVVIKALDQLLSGTPGMAGATITSDGGIALILDLPSLLKHYA